MSTKYCIANTAYWEAKGYNPINWRKSVDQTKAICHLEYAEVLAKDLENNDNVKIYDLIDPAFRAILDSAEWDENGSEIIIEDNSLAKRVAKVEEETQRLDDTVTEMLLLNMEGSL